MNGPADFAQLVKSIYSKSKIKSQNSAGELLPTLGTFAVWTDSETIWEESGIQPVINLIKRGNDNRILQFTDRILLRHFNIARILNR